MPAIAKDKISKYDDWQVEDALRTLTRAKEIQKDKKMMSLVKALAKKKIAAIATIAKQ